MLVAILTVILYLSIFTSNAVSRQCLANVRNSNNVTSNCHEFESLDAFSDLVNRNNTVLAFYDSFFELLQPIRVKNSRNISLRGLEDGGTIIHCAEGIGLSFINVAEISVSYLTFAECGQVVDSTSLNLINRTTLKFLAAIYIYNCTNVTMEGINITNSSGTGIAIFDTDGILQVLNSTFNNNGINPILPSGGGIYTEFTFCPPGTVNNSCMNLHPRKNQNSSYWFLNCNFINNNATAVDPENTSYYRAYGTNFHGLGRGGGLTVIFKGNASNNEVTIDECNFIQNGAIWGGGLYVTFHDSPLNNSISVYNTLFLQNDCYLNGGGAIDIGLLFYDKPFPRDNTMKFKGCNFTENRAKYGGGVKFYSSQSQFMDLNNIIEFVNCQWEGNMAQYGSAVDISPHVWDTLSGGYLPMPSFEDCNFTHNYAIQLEIHQEKITFRSRGKGALLSTGLSIRFKGNTIFFGNNGTAMYMSSGSVHFQENSFVLFENNTGFEGGAVALLGFSVLYVMDNSTLQFIRNTADSFGGAIIYRSNNKHDFSSSRSCFIQYAGKTELSNRFINFLFADNEAGKSDGPAYGQTIFSTTMRPCRRNCHKMEESALSCGNDAISKTNIGFSCVGNFTFNNNRENEISTSGANFNWTGNASKLLSVTSGQDLVLPIQLKDDLCQTTFGLYHISVINSSESINLDPASVYTSNNTIRLFGNPGNVVTLQLATTSFREVSLSIELGIEHCQPGYVSNETIKGIDCVCSVNTRRRYFGIDKCDTQVAYIGRAYWIGYKDGLKEAEDSLESGNCPQAFCHTNSELSPSTDYPLPTRPSREMLDLKICGSIRTGTLCGRCRQYYTTFFHSINYKCSSRKHCKVGLLLYIISELVPVTVLFLIIIFFRIQTTSGAINGFILFVQVIDMMLVDANGLIQTENWILICMKVYRFIYRMFNLEFFTLDELSFCIWEGATTMDVLAVKYFTIVYALLLVVVSIMVMKLCTIKYNRFSPERSIIHGLSAFFVMCYAQCTKVTLLVLTPSRIYKIDFKQIELAVYYQGDLTYMKGDHLKYAIPALFFLIMFVLVPVILLLVYPLCYKVFALLSIEETKLIKITCHVIPLEKMKPLFDSFQSSFKDHYRFMAGFYFLYRLALQVPFVLADSFTKFYVILEIELVIMLTIQATIYAYKKHWHNIVDILLFANLSIINAMTMHNYKRSKETSKNQSYQLEIDVLSVIQSFLIYLPLVYVVCYITTQLLCRNRQPRIELSQYDDVTDTLAMVDYREIRTSFREDDTK